MLVMCQRYGNLFLFWLVWPVSGSILQFRKNINKVSSKSWLLTCSSNINLSLPSYTGSALKRELNFCNGYLSLLYFCAGHSRRSVVSLYKVPRYDIRFVVFKSCFGNPGFFDLCKETNSVIHRVSHIKLVKVNWR